MLVNSHRIENRTTKKWRQPTASILYKEKIQNAPPPLFGFGLTHVAQENNPVLFGDFSTSVEKTQLG
jgi:hypothetical protein